MALFASTPQHSDWQERSAHATACFQAFPDRPSTRAAQEFFRDENGSQPLHWKNLPQRVERLCEVLDNWVRLTVNFYFEL